MKIKFISFSRNSDTNYTPTIFDVFNWTHECIGDLLFQLSSQADTITVHYVGGTSQTVKTTRS